MITLDSIVKVSITRETVSKTIRDLQTIAVITAHNVFSEDFRIYTSSDQLLNDGFKEDSYGYQAVSKIFMQNPQVSSVVVGKSKIGKDSQDTTNETAVDQIRNLQKATKKWFYLIMETENDEQKLSIAKYIETQQLVYVYSDSNEDTLDSSKNTDIASKLKSLSLDKSFGMYHRDDTEICPEASWVGRFATTVIGYSEWIHKELKGITPQNYTDTEIATLSKKNLSYYTEVGEDHSIEGGAKVASGERIFVILGCIWLQVRIGERMWNLLYVKERINYTNAGIEMFRTVLIQVLNEAVTNGILTKDDDFEISVPDANTLTSQVRASGVLSAIKFRARLAGAILYVDKVDGTVYA